MNNIYNAIQEDLMKFRLAQEKEHVIMVSTILGEIQRDPKKEYGDSSCLKVIRKMISNMKDVGQYAEWEMDYLKKFLPVMLTETDYVAIISEQEFNSIKDYMSYLKTWYPLNHDGKLASGIWKDMKGV